MEKSPEAKEVLLISVRNDIQAALVENLLKEQNIYCAKRHIAMGAVAALYTGMSNLGLDIYVNEKDLDQAKEVIKVYESMVSEEELERQALEQPSVDEEKSSLENDPKESRNEKLGSPFKYRMAAVLFLFIMLLLILRFLRK